MSSNIVCHAQSLSDDEIETETETKINYKINQRENKPLYRRNPQTTFFHYVSHYEDTILNVNNWNFFDNYNKLPSQYFEDRTELKEGDIIYTDIPNLLERSLLDSIFCSKPNLERVSEKLSNIFSLFK